MMSMVGKRVYLYYTGAELPLVIPANGGAPILSDTFFVLFGVVTAEIQSGLWFRMERMWHGEVELAGAPLEAAPEYHIPWASLRRAVLDTPDTKARPPFFGFRLDAVKAR